LIVVAGVAALCVARPEWLLTLPLIGLAVFAAFAGMRFTIYAVPVAALAAVYALYRLAALGGTPRRWQSALVTAATGLLLLPSLAHVASSRPPVLLERNAIAALDELHLRATPDDFVITWWDYGAAVWFFSGCPTLNSGASSYSDDNYLISRILATPSPVEAARLARETVELFVRGGGKESVVEKILARRPPDTPPEDALVAIASGARPLAAKTREAFLYLPIGLLTRFPAIRSFSARDLATGAPEPAPDFRTIGSYEWRGSTVIIDDAVAIDLLRASVTAVDGGEPALHLRALHLVEDANQDGQTVSHLELEPAASLHLVLMPDQRLGFVMDDAMLESLLVQMLVFEKWDPALFEPIVLNPRAKVYRVKI
jgi:dolichyl-diphosphooligosaccharide--protein glycosyltransferase/undecaprenyl-diphosphooligosaccharide--protein glycosyltransferase